jgi:hypothetical protein
MHLKYILSVNHYERHLYNDLTTINIHLFKKKKKKKKKKKWLKKLLSRKKKIMSRSFLNSGTLIVTKSPPENFLYNTGILSVFGVFDMIYILQVGLIIHMITFSIERERRCVREHIIFKFFVNLSLLMKYPKSSPIIRK